MRSATSAESRKSKRRECRGVTCAVDVRSSLDVAATCIGVVTPMKSYRDSFAGGAGGGGIASAQRGTVALC